MATNDEQKPWVLFFGPGASRFISVVTEAGYRIKDFPQCSIDWGKEIIPEMVACVFIDGDHEQGSMFSLLPTFRHHLGKCPIVVLEATFGEGPAMRAKALNQGATAILTKPVTPQLFAAQLKMIARQCQAPGIGVDFPYIHYYGVKVDFYTRAILDRQVHGSCVLSERAFDVLLYFARATGEVTRTDLVRAVWGWDHERRPRTLDGYLAELTTKVGNFFQLE